MAAPCSTVLIGMTSAPRPCRCTPADVTLQVRLDAARVQRVRGDPVGRPALGRPDREQHVRRLGLPVGAERVVVAEAVVQVVEDHRRAQVAARADRDDPCPAVGRQGVVQAHRQAEVTEVVRRELHAPSPPASAAAPGWPSRPRCSRAGAAARPARDEPVDGLESARSSCSTRARGPISSRRARRPRRRGRPASLRAPAPASARAVSTPMPDAAPVTIACVPVRSMPSQPRPPWTRNRTGW